MFLYSTSQSCYSEVGALKHHISIRATIGYRYMKEYDCVPINFTLKKKKERKKNQWVEFDIRAIVYQPLL